MLLSPRSPLTLAPDPLKKEGALGPWETLKWGAAYWREANLGGTEVVRSSDSGDSALQATQLRTASVCLGATSGMATTRGDFEV